MIRYPQIDPVIFRLGPLEPRWYGFMYLLGFIYTYHLIKKYYKWMGLESAELTDSVLAALVVGMIICSRTVYVLFYNLEDTLRGPWYEPLAIWHGGLSFHGGFIGVILACFYIAHRYKVPVLRMGDIVAMSAPVGVGLGRIANFINGELWGRKSDLPWAMVFPGAGPDARHPSQLYESFFEGFMMFWVMRFVWKRKPNVGIMSTTYAVGYSLIRICVEFVREPDQQVGFLFGGITMGQILSFVMVFIGIALYFAAKRHGTPYDAPPVVSSRKK